MEERVISFVLNGEPVEARVPPWRTLLEMIREAFKLTGAKEACGQGECGACTVIVDGKSVNSCLVPAVEADGKEVLTVEGLARGEALHPIQEAFLAQSGMQCGFCTPGMILSAKFLLDRNGRPGPAEIKEGIAGNFCRCTGYTKIVESIQAAAEGLKGGR